MSSSALTVFLGLLLLPAVRGLQSDDGDERLCAFTSSLQGAEPAPTNEQRGVVQENGTIRCNRGSRCYGLWEKRADGEMQLLNQGCWTYVGNQRECRGDHCVLVSATPSQMQKANYRFCCCSHDLCNANYTEAPPTASDPALKQIQRDDRGGSQTDHKLTLKETALVAMVTVAVAAILIMALFLGYRMRKRNQKHRLSAVDVMEGGNTESAVDLDNLKLLELIGRGRYGSVYRGSLSERRVAVKVFSSANRQNFTNECSIYGLPLLQHHDNIARFLTSSEKMAADGRPDFLILMDFYPHGCLSRYLSLHTVDWSTCCRMTHGVTRGLAFLHTELYRGDQYKPAVAHRDLTSRNVLVRADLSCVLTDFGLSMRLTGTRPCRPGDDETMAISEVGTVRYMSPEVLGGALNLRDCETALKQVDVYALGLLYWESFRRCPDLFPGEAVPEYQLAFQAELGNHPSIEDMQTLVVREKYRPKFPEEWKENILVLRSLKETMEDCWDQDAEARLTAQCAEERLAELTLLSIHTALRNHRNLSHSRWSSQVGSASPYIEDLQVGVVKNLQGEPVLKTGSGGAEGSERNRNSINYERQQARSSSSDCTMGTSSILPPAAVFSTIPECQHTGGAVPGVPVYLTEEDLEATKLDPREVDKNLKRSSDENLTEHSQKQFGSEPQTSKRLFHQSSEVNIMASAAQGELWEEGGIDALPSSIHPLPKQLNLPQRPTSLHLLPKNKETSSVCSRLRLGKLKVNHQQVETGVAKMNMVMVATAAEPHPVTMVTNNVNIRSSAASGREAPPTSSSCSAGVPTLVTNVMVGGGRTNPAGPQEEEEEGGGADGRLSLLNFSPDEHEPLLRREHLPAESDPPPPPHLHQLHHLRHHSRAGNVSNNNNNRLAVGSDLKVHEPERKQSSEAGGRDCSPEPEPGTGPVSNLEHKILGPVSVGGASSDEAIILQAPPFIETQGSSLCQEDVPGPVLIQNPEDPLVHSTVTTEFSDCRVEASGTQTSQDQNLDASGSDTWTLPQKPSPESPASHPGLSLEVPTTQTEALESSPTEGSRLEPAGPPEPAGLQSGLVEPGPMKSQERQTKTRRPERPCSLDLSSSYISSDSSFLTDGGSLSATGEKIKRRVKTPYMLKKWRPASWVVSTDTALDLDFDFDSSSSQIHSGLQRPGSSGIPKINQSKSSMAVFLVGGGGATAITTSEPDRMTCF
ncbi:bone morphogenetic protein receptor type-2-like isoform X2 [Melanotaenia boesemani]|uniref:bone morphogenetic protein receptor type-2-like isoform X2 n=1 Tax=Melanotaenia boesemani TaxID=1250792 RepID=UPI001C05A560|nr:bone morphogenetic protein receptor type-2-like isoform X2 [Melanotaenia boesemani]